MSKSLKMKENWSGRALGVAVVAMAVAGLTSTAHAAGGAHHRTRQQVRISQGVATGSLTMVEAASLRHEQHRISVMKRSAKADGRVTRGESRRINRAQKRASAHIYRLKHNHRTR